MQDRPPRRRFAALALLGLAAAACAINPATGRPELVLVSTATEQRLGAEEAVKVEQELGLAAHAPSARWTAEVGARLAAHAPRRELAYTFRVVDVAPPNAFALPGGPIYVSRGLLALVNREDELAGVLAHEIAHVAARHAAQRITAATPFALVFGVPAALVGSVSHTLGELVALPGAVVSGLALSAYTRQQEYEADRLGAGIAAAAGYDPAGLADALAALAREDALRGEAAGGPDFFATHPDTPDRVARVRERAAALARGAPPRRTPEREAVLARLDGLLLGHDPRHGVFHGDDFLQPTRGFGVTVPAGWARAALPQALVAVDPDSRGETFVLVQTRGEGDDPVAAARADGLDATRLAALRRLTVHGLPAARLESESGENGFSITWIVLDGRVERVAAACPRIAFAGRRETFRRLADGFHRLSPEERASVRALRLRVATARAGETLAALADRTRSEWPAPQLAVANGLADGATPGAGARVKIARDERWRPAPE